MSLILKNESTEQSLQDSLINNSISFEGSSMNSQDSSFVLEESFEEMGEKRYN